MLPGLLHCKLVSKYTTARRGVSVKQTSDTISHIEPFIGDCHKRLLKRASAYRTVRAEYVQLKPPMSVTFTSGNSTR